VGVGLVEQIADKLPRSHSYLHRRPTDMGTLVLITATRFIEGSVGLKGTVGRSIKGSQCFARCNMQTKNFKLKIRAIRNERGQ